MEWLKEQDSYSDKANTTKDREANGNGVLTPEQVGC
ncbi:hypothetical protein Vi05172_g11744 [Venturia inaequalis]|nr:hypothetical protein Vi05172_g11744 [Venturia inaequalis]